MNKNLITKLTEIVGHENAHYLPAELVAYSFDATFQESLPELVLRPSRTEEVAAILAIANRENLPIIPRGAGTNLSGGTIPLSGGVVLSLTRMNRILEIDRVNSSASVQPGVVNGQFQTAVEKEDLFYPPDPASLKQCTLGGNVSCNAGGPRCLKYGVTKDYVLGLTVVLAGGEVLVTGGNVLKSASGYQLGQVFVGAEGTLGVITELILRLLPLPRFNSTITAIFPTIDQAAEAVTAVMAAGVLPVALELMDGVTINLVEDYLKMGLPRSAEAMLILEQDGNDAVAIERELVGMIEVCRGNGAIECRSSGDREERESLWRARRAVSPALGRRARYKLGEDICVPRSKLPMMVRRIREIGEGVGLEIPVFGHAGDGNLHPNILFNDREGELSRVEAAASQIVRSAIELGGAISGEHGIGIAKKEYLEDALGPVAMRIMRDIKRSLDPKGIMNPQKLFPDTNQSRAPREEG